MSLHLGPFPLVPALLILGGLLGVFNPWGIGDSIFRLQNIYPKVAYSPEEIRRQTFVLGRTVTLGGFGLLIWFLLLDLGVSRQVLVGFAVVAIPCAVALALYTIYDTVKRWMKARDR
ncbi:hypothetical protein [Streptomyces cellostaticus]|uniref:hypothetical protein n=1 Tax=Streptomyces TaxID=1883 RepID=UPI002026E4F0|nr:hypothetical protein [Streptomyces cellostaticus]